MNCKVVSAFTLSAGILLLTQLTGCEQKKQSYAEAVQLYAAEMTELERLEARRIALMQTIEKPELHLEDLQAQRDLVNSVVGDAAKMREATKGLLDPTLQANADKTIEDNLKKVQSELDKQTAQAESEAKELKKLKEDAERELPELERQIDRQKARVEAARQAKEALAPKSE